MLNTDNKSSLKSIRNALIVRFAAMLFQNTILYIQSASILYRLLRNSRHYNRYRIKTPIIILLISFPIWSFADADPSTRTYFGEFTHTLSPAIGPTPLFLRESGTSNGKIKDVFGAWQDAFAGEARFSGANRVANLIDDSESFVTGWWINPTVTRGSVLATPNPLVVDGRETIWPFTRSSSRLDALLILMSRPYKPVPHVFSIVIDGDNTSGNVKVSFVQSADTTVVSSFIVTPAPGANRYCFPFTPIDATNHRVELSLTSGGMQQLAVGTAQMEAIYLQPKVCNHYVSRGVPGGSYPHHGAGVDGVQYFNTIHQWGYASGNYGLVVKQTPILINPEFLSGLLLEQFAINKLLYNNSFSNPAWAKTGVILADSIDSTYGPKTLTKLVEDDSNGIHGISAIYCNTCGAPYSEMYSTTFSAVVESAERSNIYLEISDGINVIAHAYYNLLNGTVGNFFGQYANADIWAEGSAWRISLTVDPGPNWASYPGNAFVRLQSVDDSGKLVYSGVPGKGIYVGLTQWEINEMATTYTGDQTTSSKWRKADSMSISLPPILPLTTNFTMSIDVTPWFYTGTPAKKAWLFVINAFYDYTNRFGLQMRPGPKAGMWRNAELMWDVDYYLNSPIYDGAEIVLTMNHGDITRAIFTFGSSPLSSDGMSGTGFLMEDIYGKTTNDGTPTTFYNAIMPDFVTLGAVSPSHAVRHPMSYKNLSIFPSQFSKLESILWSRSW